MLERCLISISGQLQKPKSHLTNMLKKTNTHSNFWRKNGLMLSLNQWWRTRSLLHLWRTLSLLQRKTGQAFNRRDIPSWRDDTSKCQTVTCRKLCQTRFQVRLLNVELLAYFRTWNLLRPSFPGLESESGKGQFFCKGHAARIYLALFARNQDLALVINLYG